MPWFSTLLDDLLDLVAPNRCLGCDETYPGWPPAPLRAVMCSTCKLTIERADEVVEPPQDFKDRILAPWLHLGPVARAVHVAKYGGSPQDARRLGALLAAERDARALRADVVIPVPLSRERLRSRGFNQAAEIARSIGVPMASGAVVRVRETVSQVGLSREARRENVRDAFALRDASELHCRSVVIVDDVITTGATMRAVADAIAPARPSGVLFAAVARARLFCAG